MGSPIRISTAQRIFAPPRGFSQLITSLMLIDTNETCIVEGDIEQSDSGFVKLTHFKSDITVRDGDKVVTSNISDKYLQGILIGYAKDVTPDSNNLTQSGYLVPAVDFNNLQEVLIITEMKKQ